MLDVHPGLVTQVVPELGEFLSRHVHRTAPDVLVQLVAGRRDAVPKKQQHADLAVQRTRVAEFGFQQLDLGKDL